MKFRAFIKAILLLIALMHSPTFSQHNNLLDSSKTIIKFKSHGGPCFSLCVGESDLSCCPAYSFSIDGDGTVNYEGIIGVKIRGKKAHSISVKDVEELLQEFYKIDFFSLKDSYDDKMIDHRNAYTISLTVGEKTKSIYIFNGEPEALDKLLRKIYQISQVSQYVGRT